jgi:hypothetical protein
MQQQLCAVAERQLYVEYDLSERARMYPLPVPYGRQSLRLCVMGLPPVLGRVLTFGAVMGCKGGE